MKRILPVVLALLTATAAPAADPARVIEEHGDGHLAFERVVIGPFEVYHHQRTLHGAVVEKDQIVYRFDRASGELLSRKAVWRDDVDDRTPAPVITAGEAGALAPGSVLFADLYIITPDSDVFPLERTPSNPCWVVRSEDAAGFQHVTIVDAVTGERLGPGVPPPAGGYSLTGPWYDNPCDGGWTAWSGNAHTWFETMGYPTDETLWPTQAEVQAYVQSETTAVFYELAHGGSFSFGSGCTGGTAYETTYASEIEAWIAGHGRMPFAFIGSCGGMCSISDGSLSYEFRKGSSWATTTVGYCGMGDEICGDCWVVSIDWQNAFFSYVNAGDTVEDAYEQALADFPSCAGPVCMRFAGDTTMVLVPAVERRSPEWTDATEPPLGDLGRAGGIAWADYDGDGDQDVYVANADGVNRLFRNDGGTFTDVTAAPLDDAGVGMGVSWGDYDGDGDHDLYLVNDGANRLFRNDAGTFADATAAPLDDPGEGYGVSWVDYDLDGDLDLFVANNGTNRLYENNVPGRAFFTDATSAPMDDPGNSQSAVWADYDLDGDQDCYLVNRGTANRLLRNDAGAFVDVAAGALADAADGIGAAWGDYDNDGDPDLYLANLNAANRLLRNDGGGFTDVSVFPLSDGGAGTGVVWLDAENDGDLDLYLGKYGSANLLMRNSGPPDYAFSDGSIAPLTNEGFVWGLASADYDGDGDVDLYLGNNGLATGSNRLFENGWGSLNHWLVVDLEGVISNRSAVGARVRIVTGGVEQWREVAGSTGYLSQDSPELEFGLGAAATIDTLEVVWPSGLVERAVGVAADQRLEVTEGDWTGVAGGAVDGRPALRGNYPNPFNPVTLIQYELPRPSNVTLTVFDLSGREVRTLEAGAALPAGRHTTAWDGRDDAGRDVASGVYYYRLAVGGETFSNSMVLLK
ncbi:MAG: T9SS type A sorting domain-containing protein [Candidatus Eisenbacteria bacterium]|nr:T9SS type A sorting domain-containing protein [Candidatus Eisenbacteria bacterium]